MLSKNPARNYRKNGIPITAVFPDGTMEPILNLQEFCDKHRINRGTVRRVLSGKIRHCKGIRFYNEHPSEELKTRTLRAIKPHKRHRHRRRKELCYPLLGRPNTDPSAILEHMKTVPKKWYFTHPKTKIKYQIFAKNFRDVAEALYYHQITDRLIGDYAQRHYMYFEFTKIVSKELPLIIHRNFDISMLKRLGFYLM